MLYYVARYVTHQTDRRRHRHYLTEAGDWSPDRGIALSFGQRKAATGAAKLRPGAFVDGVREKKEAAADG